MPASVLERAIAWAAAGRALLDLRAVEVYEAAHLKGSTSLPFSLLLQRGMSPQETHPKVHSSMMDTRPVSMVQVLMLSSSAPHSS